MPAGPFLSKRQSFSFVRDQAGGIEISFWFLGLIFKYKGYRNLPIFGSSYTHVESDCVNYCVAEVSARSRNQSYLFFFFTFLNQSTLLYIRLKIKDPGIHAPIL